MKETRMPPALSANLVANSGNTIPGVSVIITICIRHTLPHPTPNPNPLTLDNQM